MKTPRIITSEKSKAILPFLVIFALLFVWLLATLYFDNRAEQKGALQRARTIAQINKDTEVVVDNTYRVTLPCSNATEPLVQENAESRVVTYTCTQAKPDKSIGDTFYTSLKTYRQTELTPAIDYDFCGTYTDGATGEVMTNVSNQETVLEGKKFRICHYKGGNGTGLLTAKTIRGESLQTYATVVLKSDIGQDKQQKFRSYVQTLDYLK